MTSIPTSAASATTPNLASPEEATGAQGTGRTWARDFAIVGAVSCFLALFLVSGTFLGWPTLVGTTLAGAGTGAVLGTLLAGAPRTGLAGLPWPVLGLLFLALGAAWGAVVGAIGGTVLAIDMGGGGDVGRRGVFPADLHLFFMSFAALAGAAQLGWFGLAYLWADRRRVPTWPLLIGAAGTPFLGWAALGMFGRMW